jgi:hypothetical protein
MLSDRIHTIRFHAEYFDFGTSVWIPACAGTTG